jgi:hypothetical protein
MPDPKRLVLFVEGPADSKAACVLVKKLLTDLNAWDCVFLDPAPFQVGNAAEVARDSGHGWLRLLHAAAKRRKLGAVLLLQDGDISRIQGETFCPRQFGERLAGWAKSAGGGTLFSVACVFACMEYESWLMACADQLAGLPLPDGRPGLRAGTLPFGGDLESAPRDAKGWLDAHMEEGYKNTRDQELLTQLMIHHLDTIRSRNMRSFRRLESAVVQLVAGIRSGNHVVTPTQADAAL